MVKLHLDDDLNLNLKTQPFDDIMHAVEHGLEDMASTLIPYGLHTFGVALSGDALDQDKGRINRQFRSWNKG